MAKRKINYDKIRISEKQQSTSEAMDDVERFLYNLAEYLYLVQDGSDGIVVESSKDKNTK